ncbi:MAG: hypothetical protein R6V01_10700 [Thermoplasmatota archaeon]
MNDKAKKIREMFRMGYFDQEFSTDHISENNPMNNFVMLENGLIVPKDQLKDIIMSNIISLIGEEEPNGGPVEEPIDLEKEYIHDKKNNAQKEQKKDETQRSIFDY